MTAISLPERTDDAPATRKVCRFPDCGRKASARGWCSSHYGQWLEGKPLRAVKAHGTFTCCPGPECRRAAVSKGLCQRHYQQMRRNGKLAPIAESSHHLSIDQRFWQKVDTSGSCHLFQGSTIGGGYGQISIDGRRVLVHRLAWELAYSEKIPEGLYADHLCHIPACVLVPHLRLATPAQNVANLPGRPDCSLTDVDGLFWLGSWDGRFRAVLSGGGVSAIVGHFQTLEDGRLALEQARAGYQLQLPGMERLTAAYDGGVL